MKVTLYSNNLIYLKQGDSIYVHGAEIEEKADYILPFLRSEYTLVYVYVY
mgnify:CR=1 FL=1